MMLAIALLKNRIREYDASNVTILTCVTIAIFHVLSLLSINP